jgi:hypothetical protein
MMKVVFGLLALLLTVCVSASGQEGLAFGSIQSLGATSSYSPTSGHILIGLAQQRHTFEAGFEYTHRLLGSDHARLDYSGEFNPLFRESDPTAVATEYTINGQTVVTPITPTRVVYATHASIGGVCGGGPTCSYIYPVFGQDETTYAASIAPLGARAIFLPRRRIQPTFETNLGVILSTRDIPVDGATLFNYQFTFGPGVQVFATRRTAVRLEYVYRHISNANSGTVNPGIDQGVFRLTLSRYR